MPARRFSERQCPGAQPGPAGHTHQAQLTTRSPVLTVLRERAAGLTSATYSQEPLLAGTRPLTPSPTGRTRQPVKSNGFGIARRHVLFNSDFANDFPFRRTFGLRK